MSTSLLKTKLYIPQAHHNVFPRTRLHQALETSLAGKLTLVAAPAGFGKTTLLSSWIFQSPHIFAWISLDESDSDPVSFWAYVVGALQQVSAGWKQPLLTGINPDQLPPIRNLLTILINQLDSASKQIILILDDYHLISNREVHDDLAFLIDHQHHKLHMIIATRADPPLRIARLRVKGQLAELRSDDLRFTQAETTAYLNDILALDLQVEDIQRLENRTEGWAAGLQLAALSMRGRSDKHRFIAEFSGSHHYILEYLTEEVIKGLSEDLRRFLLLTSILDRFNAPLCDRVFMEEHSSSCLAELQRQNLFIVPLDDEHIWFRYHHLFRDLLKNRVQREFNRKHILAIYRQTSQYMYEVGNIEEAIKYAFLAHDDLLAADLIEQTASQTMLNGRLRTLFHWLDRLPEQLLNSRPRLGIYRAWALSLSGEPQIAEKILLEIRDKSLAHSPLPENIALRGELAALLTSIITYKNDPHRVVEEAKEALACLPEENQLPRARVYIALGTAYAYLDKMDLAIQKFRLARKLARRAGNPFLAAAATELLTGMQIFHLGQLKTGADTLQETIELGTASDGTPLAFTGTAYILLAELYLEWNDLDQAKRCLDTGLTLIEQGGIGYSLLHAYCAKAYVMQALGNHAEAVQSLLAAEKAVKETPLLHMVIHHLACQTRFALWRGDVTSAGRWARLEPDTLPCAIPKNIPAYLREVQQIALARVYCSRGEMDKVLATCSPLRVQAESAGRMAHVIQIDLLSALALLKIGDMPAAREQILRSLLLAESEGYTRTYLEGGPEVLKLMRSIEGQNLHLTHIRRLLSAFGEPSERVPSKIRAIQPSQTLIEPLSRREREVLGLIVAGFTNGEIADKLVISLNTVKKHTTHIYGKLGVNNRAQAIAKSRELEL